MLPDWSFSSPGHRNSPFLLQPGLAIAFAFVFSCQAKSRHTFRVRFSISSPVSPYHARSRCHLNPNLAIPCAFVFPSPAQSRHTNRIRFPILAGQSRPLHWIVITPARAPRPFWLYMLIISWCLLLLLELHILCCGFNGWVGLYHDVVNHLGIS